MNFESLLCKPESALKLEFFDGELESSPEDFQEGSCTGRAPLRNNMVVVANVIDTHLQALFHAVLSHVVTVLRHEGLSG